MTTEQEVVHECPVTPERVEVERARLSQERADALVAVLRREFTHDAAMALLVNGDHTFKTSWVVPRGCTKIPATVTDYIDGVLDKRHYYVEFDCESGDRVLRIIVTERRPLSAPLPVTRRDGAATSMAGSGRCWRG